MNSNKKKSAKRRVEKGKLTGSENPGRRLVEKTAAEVLAGAEQQEKFVELYCNPVPAPAAILWCRERCDTALKVEMPSAFQPDFVDRLAPGEKPGALPAHQAGKYYCLDFSSIFMAAPLLAVGREFAAAGVRPYVVDLCASPGGKSIFAWRTLAPEMLAANEVVGKRLGALISNFERCKISPAVVTHRDPSWWSERAADGADVVIVDAPCSGQSLPFRRIEALGAFHPALITKNSLRQRRILAHAGTVVRPGGFLLYTTCTFSRRENEGVIEWFSRRFEHFVPVEVPSLEPFRSELTATPAYRLFPFSGIGAGGFTVLFQRSGQGSRVPFDIEPVRRF